MVSNCDEDDEMSSFLRDVYGEELDIDVMFPASEVVERSDITLATILNGKLNYWMLRKQ
jgi:hypothetical protein